MTVVELSKHLRGLAVFSVEQELSINDYSTGRHELESQWRSGFRERLGKNLSDFVHGDLFPVAFAAGRGACATDDGLYKSVEAYYKSLVKTLELHMADSIPANTA